MSTSTNRRLGVGSGSTASEIERACHEFEVRLRAGEHPRIEDVLEDVPEHLRRQVLRKLLAVEIRDRRGRGDEPKEWEYLERFPEVSLSDLPVNGGSTVRPPPDKPLPSASEVTLDSKFANLRLHQRGGLGEVVRAEDLALRRQVALKFIRADAAADGESRVQFLLEAEITGRLDHPGVVPVFGIGTTHDDRPFYAMRFIDGTTLRQAIDDFHERAEPGHARRMQLHRLLAHVTAACRTVHYAHNRGVIHRDIKPDNIMIGRFGETFVVDWGLAMPVERDAHARGSGEATLLDARKDSTTGTVNGAGTPSYMSPEQARGAPYPLGPASDIFCLGATLYCLLAGRPPYDPFHHDVRGLAQRCEYPRLRDVHRDTPRALEAICQKAMRPSPSDRYQTAGELADDLERWMADEPVTACTETTQERIIRFFRRHRVWGFALAGCTVMAIVLFGGSSLLLGQMARQEHGQRLAAEAATQAAETAREQGLITAAELGAKVVAAEVEHRWQVLGDAARSPSLRETLAAQGQAGTLTADERQHLQAWLDGLYAQHQQSLRFQSLFILDEKGFQIVCSPASDENVGAWLGYKNVFHGGPQDLDPNTPRDEIRPSRQDVLSAAFLSAVSEEVCVALSVPIWNTDRGDADARVVGMLAMRVAMADFTELDTLVGDAFLVDLRENHVGDAARRGLILHHSRSRRSDYHGDIDAADLAWLDQDRIAQADRLTNLVRRSARHGHRMTVEAGWWGALADPLLPNARPAATAAWPVKLRTGEQVPWLVMVRQR